MSYAKNDQSNIYQCFDKLHKNALKSNLVNENDLYEAIFVNGKSNNSGQNGCRNKLPHRYANDNLYQVILFSIIVLLCLIVGTPIVKYLIDQILGIRCFVPNNYLIWEATRPISNCHFCQGITGPLILPNMTQEEFLVQRKKKLKK